MAAKKKARRSPAKASRGARKKAAKKKPRKDPNKAAERGYCDIRIHAERTLGTHVSDARASAILRLDKKWVNGTELRYYFFDRSTDGQNVKLKNGKIEWRTWTTSQAQKDVVRKAFDRWSGVGIGLKFEEVAAREDAQIRIGFMRGDGSWSYVGRDILEQAAEDRTMNLGWDLTTPHGFDTAVHEIGHTVGLPHEHQNPNAGIVWNEDAVYKHFETHQGWKKSKTHFNVIRKIAASQVGGSDWDPDSIMHYEFAGGLIREPAKYKAGLMPRPGLSRLDQDWIRSFYPPLDHNHPELAPGQSVPLGLEAGEQRNFSFSPNETRNYRIQTFGPADVVMVLFEDEAGKLRYRSGEDDSGEDANAFIRFKLVRGRRYVLRVRMYYSERPRGVSLMLW